MPELKRLPVLTIAEPALPIREAMDEHKLRELAESIREVGLLQPLVVKATESGAEIVAGHRRYMAVRMLGWVDVPCIVYAADEIPGSAAMLAENLYREDITSAEEAIFFDQLMQVHNIDTEALAAMVRQKRDYVEDRLRLFRGDHEVFEALRRRDILFSVARILNKCKDELTRRNFLQLASSGGHNARTVQRWVDEANALPANDPLPAAAEPANGSAPAPAVDLPRCEFCGTTDNQHIMRYIPLHIQCSDYMKKRVREAMQGE